MEIIYHSKKSEEATSKSKYGVELQHPDLVIEYLQKPPAELLGGELHIYLDDPNFISWLKSMRKNYRHWTQEELSIQSNVSIAYVSQIERNTIEAKVKTYDQIISALLFNIDILDGQQSFALPSENCNQSMPMTIVNTTKNLDVALLQQKITDLLVKIYNTDDYYLHSVLYNTLESITDLQAGLEFVGKESDAINKHISDSVKSFNQGLETIKIHFGEKQ